MPRQTGYFFDLFIDMVFIIDLALNFRTAFEDEHGVIITDGRAIVSRLPCRCRPRLRASWCQHSMVMAPVRAIRSGKLLETRVSKPG